MGAATTQRLIPKRLEKGGTIAVVSLSMPVTDPPDAWEQGVALLEKAGYTVKLMPNAKNQRGYLAGTEEEKLSDLHAAFSDSAVDAILCSRGGYGATRILDGIDYDLVKKNPKVFIGFSDVTAPLIAFYQRCGLTGFYGPMLTSNLINGEPYSEKELFDMVTGTTDGGVKKAPYEIKNIDTYHSFKKGAVEAPLTGGNLSLLAALCGTAYQMQAAGHIVFIEDWQEGYYAIDRKMQQLKMAGALDGIAGLLFCDFSALTPNGEATIPELLKALSDDLGVPCGYGFSVGHGEETGTLPIGINARFDAGSGALTLLEDPVL